MSSNKSNSGSNKNKKGSEASTTETSVDSKTDSIEQEDRKDGIVVKRESSGSLQSRASKNANANDNAAPPTPTPTPTPTPPLPIVSQTIVPPSALTAQIDHLPSTIPILDEKLLQEQEVQHYNATFYAIVSDFYADRVPANTKAHLFEAVLLEFWKFLDTSVHRKVFQTICSFNGEERQEQLKKCLTVDAWERANKYVLDFMDHHYTPIPGKPIPAIFRNSDLPLLQHQRTLIQMGAPKSTLAGPTPTSGLHQPPVPSVVYNDTIYVPKDECIPNVAPSNKKKRKSLTQSVEEDLEEKDEKPKIKTRQPKMADENRYLEGEPLEKDVMYGRGGGTNNHLGNILYLIEKLKLQPGYTFLATQKGKKVISQDLVDRVHAYGGRFVAKDPETNRWYEVDDGVARRKASQTLREDKTPYDQTVKRQCLMRKLKEFQSGKRQGRSQGADNVNIEDGNHDEKSIDGAKNLISPQEQNATQMLLELGAKKESANSNEEAAV